MRDITDFKKMEDALHQHALDAKVTSDMSDAASAIV
jgi:hypothetical protein